MYTETGPITRSDVDERLEFLQAIRALKARGGGDCEELCFKGMIDAQESGPQPGSSMYVFTDAPPKDPTAYNRENVRELANLNEEVKINFFQHESCGTDFHYCNDLATATGGRLFELSSTLDLKELGKLV